MKYKSTATVRYNGRWVVANVGRGIGNYYKSIVDKLAWIKTSFPMHGILGE